MNNNSQPDSKQRIEHILSTLFRYRTIWIAPAIIAMVLSVVYVVALRSETWSAKQSLIIRDDMLGQSFKPGRFDSIESMKSVQETILEIARKPQVIRKTLEQLGPESPGWFGKPNDNWPSDETIENVQGAISFHAPNGAEFGKTEVIVLNTKASSRERSRQFIELLLNEIIIKFDEVRTQRLQSIESELIQARDAAMLALEESRAKLQAMDESLGSDFASMSSMSDSQSSDITIKREISQIRLEKRETEKELEQRKIALQQLQAAKDNPQRIFSTSATLIRLLPALGDLKTELIKTRGELAVMEGKYEAIHPSYREARGSIEAMKLQLHLHLDSSIAGIRNDISLAEDRLARLNQEMESLNGRLVNLSSKRANLVTLGHELDKRAEIANNEQSDLSEIQGLLQVTNAELIARVDEPQVSTRPDGMGKKATVIACGLGGLMLGLGFVMLIAPPFNEEREDASSSRRGGNTAGAQLETADSFFDSRTFEKIIVSAATAATTAVQSAAKATQFFKPPKTEHPNRQDEGSPEAPATFRKKSPDLSSAENAPLNPVVAEAASAAPIPQRDSHVPPGTASVQELLEAANEIANPAPVASRPLSQPPRRIKIRPAEENPIKPEPHSVSPIPQPASEASHKNLPLNKASTSGATSKPAHELTADQSMDLQGTRIRPLGSSQQPPANAPQPSTTESAEKEVVLSDFGQPASLQVDADDSIPDPISSLTRRAPNVRPVDLAKSASEEDSTFVRIDLSSGDSELNDGVPESTNPESSESAEPEFVHTYSKDQSPGQTDVGQTPTDQDDTSSMAVSDQIQKLRDSIAKFANPENRDENREQ